MKHYILCFLILLYSNLLLAQKESIGNRDGSAYNLSTADSDEEYDLVRTDKDGNIVYKISSFEKNNLDTTKESYIIFGYTNSINNRITSKPSDYDYWLIKKELFIYEIYPNPTEGITYVYLTDKNCKIEVFSLNGYLIFEQRLENNFNTIDLSYISQNIYIYKIVDTENKIQKIGKICVL